MGYMTFVFKLCCDGPFSFRGGGGREKIRHCGVGYMTFVFKLCCDGPFSFHGGGVGGGGREKL